MLLDLTLGNLEGQNQDWTKFSPSYCYGQAHQVLLNRVPEQATEDSVRYQIYY